MGNAQPKYDSLEYASELKEAGFTEVQSKTQAKALFRVIDQQLVTKQDVKELETKLTYGIKELETKLTYDIKELDVKIKELEVKMSHDILDIKRDIKELEVKLSHDIKDAKNDVIFKLGGLIVTVFALLGTLPTILKTLG